jgi:hypothetical protein
VIAGSDERHAVLQAAPSSAIVVSAEASADVVYQIVRVDPSARSSAFLVTEKGAYDKRSVKVQAINYDARYYGQDHFASSSMADESGIELIAEDGEFLIEE